MANMVYRLIFVLVHVFVGVHSYSYVYVFVHVFVRVHRAIPYAMIFRPFRA